MWSDLAADTRQSAINQPLIRICPLRAACKRESRGERVRVYRSEPLLADSAAAYPTTVRLDIAGLPANFMPLFAGGRTAFVPEGEQVVVHGGVSVEELIVPFVKVSYVIGTE